MKKRWDVIRSNQFIEASINLSLVEARILDIVFSQITALPAEEREAAQVIDYLNDFTIHVGDYVAIYSDCKINNAYSVLKEASERLFTRYFSYYTAINDDEAVSVHKTRWVYDIGYSENEGYITVMVNPIVLSFVGHFKECFTAYNLTNKVGLNGRYSYRLYDMCKQWENKKYPTELSLFTLRDRLGLEENEYSTMSNFKRVVLDPAIKQINENPASDIVIEYNQTKKGKVITHFVFIVKTKKTKNKTIEGVCKNLTKTQRDVDTPDLWHGLTDNEQAIIKATADKHIKDKGITDPRHQANIHAKALSERWGLGEHDKETDDYNLQNKQVMQQIKADNAKQKAEKEALALQKQSNEEFISNFESLPNVEQERILDEVEASIGNIPFLGEAFRKSRKAGTAHTDIAIRSQFKKVMAGENHGG